MPGAHHGLTSIIFLPGRVFLSSPSRRPPALLAFFALAFSFSAARSWTYCSPASKRPGSTLKPSLFTSTSMRLESSKNL